MEGWDKETNPLISGIFKINCSTNVTKAEKFPNTV